MDYVGSHYFKFTRIILSVIGVWPYDEPSVLRKIHKALLVFFFFQAIAAQLSTCLTTTCNADHLLKISPLLMTSFVFILKYLTFVIQEDKIKTSLDTVQDQWRTARSDEETRIMLHYADVAQAYIKLFAISLYAVTGAAVVGQFTPCLLNILVSHNMTLFIQPIGYAEYFIDQNKYFYVSPIAMTALVVVGATTIIATEAVVILFTNHECGLLKIMEHRLEETFPVEESRKYSISRSDREIFAKGVGIVMAHTSLMKFTQHVLSCFDVSYFILLITGVCALTTSLFHLYQAVNKRLEVVEIIVSVAKICADVIYMFHGNYIGQQVTDNTNRVIEHMYSAAWYRAPIPVQKLLLTMMQQHTRGMEIIVGGVYKASFEGFSTLVRTSMSYFMFIRSTR